MPRTKSTNQFYGKYFECAVVAAINNQEIDYNEPYDKFTSTEILEMEADAKQLKDYLNTSVAEYVGNHTSTAVGDIISDNNSIELKYIGTNSTGTYHNTSLNYFQKFGFNFKDYAKKEGLYDMLQSSFGNEYCISEDDISPVSREVSSEIRHTYSDVYKSKIIPVDESWRKKFVADLADYFKKNPDKAAIYLYDILNKNTGNENKAAPDRLITFNYKTKVIKEINMKELLNKSQEAITIETAPLSFTINGVRTAISWQNGVGLNNPTLRVFI